MQVSFAVSVLVKVGQGQTGFQLSANFLFQAVGELDAAVVFFPAGPFGPDSSAG